VFYEVPREQSFVEQLVGKLPKSLIKVELIWKTYLFADRAIVWKVKAENIISLFGCVFRRL
jgi:hypothetical protein